MATSKKKTTLTKNERKKMKKKMQHGSRLNEKEVKELERNLKTKGLELSPYNSYHDEIGDVLVVSRDEEDVVVFFNCEGLQYATVYSNVDLYVYHIIDAKKSEIMYAPEMTIPEVKDVLRIKTNRRFESDAQIYMIEEEYDVELYEEMQERIQRLKTYQKPLLHLFDYIIKYDKEFGEEQDKILFEE